MEYRSVFFFLWALKTFWVIVKNIFLQSTVSTKHKKSNIYLTDLNTQGLKWKHLMIPLHWYHISWRKIGKSWVLPKREKKITKKRCCTTVSVHYGLVFFKFCLWNKTSDILFFSEFLPSSLLPTFSISTFTVNTAQGQCLMTILWLCLMESKEISCRQWFGITLRRMSEKFKDFWRGLSL